MLGQLLALLIIVVFLLYIRRVTPSPFQYKKLTTGEFRVLCLHGGKVEEDLRGTLLPWRYDSEDPSSNYEALSYVWDQPPRTDDEARGVQKSILLQNPGKTSFCPLPVAPNLSLALSELRRESGRRLIWVDSICINQKDPIEKGEQVRRMSKIYSTAEKVIAWLGGNDEEFIDLLRKLDQSFKADPTRGFLIGSEIFERNTRIRERFQSKLTDGERKAWERFVCLKFWQRSWILQEVCLAKEVILRLGHQEVYWEDIGLMMEQFDPHYLDVTDDFTLVPGTRIDFVEASIRAWLRPMQMLRYQWEERWKYGDFRLLSLVTRMRDSGCQDPRDRVFSLLAIASDQDATENPPEYDLRAKYVAQFGELDGNARFDALLAMFRRDRPFASEDEIMQICEMTDTYGQLVVSYAKMYKLLDGLNGHTGEALPGLPSWLPNFWSKRTMFSLIEGVPGPAEWLHGDNITFSAGTSRHPTILWPEPPNIRQLQVRAYYVDEIVDVADPFEPPTSGNLLSAVDSIVTWAEKVNSEIQRWSPGCYKTAKAYEDAVRRTSIANLTTVRSYSRPTLATEEEIYRKPDPEGLALHGGRKQLNIQGAWHEIAATHPGPVLRAQTGRRPYLTKGGYIGIGRRDLLIGDRVYVFFGGQTPFILRQVAPSEDKSYTESRYGGTFQLLGESYLHGVMMGEIFSCIIPSEAERLSGVNYGLQQLTPQLLLDQRTVTLTLI